MAPGGKEPAALGARPCRQRRDVGGDVQHGPVPEAAAARGVGVEHGDRIALGAGRGAAPAQLRGFVLAAGAHLAAALGGREGLAVREGFAADGRETGESWRVMAAFQLLGSRHFRRRWRPRVRLHSVASAPRAWAGWRRRGTR